MYQFPPKFESKLYDLRNMMEQLLYYVPRGIPDFTDHGVKHSRRIESILMELLIPICNESDNTKLNDYECFCIIACCWLHDLGCIIERNNHGNKSAQIIDEHLSAISIFTDDETRMLKGPILKIISSHTDSPEYKIIGKISVEDLAEKIEIQILENGRAKRIQIKLRLIASIFRLADACDICADRAPFLVYKLIQEFIPDGSKEFWLSHKEITDVSTKCDAKSFVIRVDNANIAKLVIDKFKSDIQELKPILNELEFYYTNVEIIEMGGPDWQSA